MVLFILLILLELIYKNILQRHIMKPQEYLHYTLQKIFNKIYNVGHLKVFNKNKNIKKILL